MTNFAHRILTNQSDTQSALDVVYDLQLDDIPHAVATIAKKLCDEGVSTGDRVIVGADCRLLSGLVYLAAIYCGAIAVPIARDNLAGLRNSGVGAKLCWYPDDKWLAQHDSQIPCLIGDACIGNTPMEPVHVEQDALAALLPTSGSTGTSRLVRVTHRNLICNTEDIVTTQSLQADDKALICMPLSYCFALSVMQSHLACGASLVFDSRFMFTQKVIDTLIDQECTSFSGVPLMYQTLPEKTRLFDAPQLPLRRFLQAGGRLDTQVIDRYRATFPGVDFYVMYGQTEATARISTLPPSLFDAKKGSVGLPLPQVEVRIDSAPGESRGEVWVRGDSITPGYWHDPAATTKRWNDSWMNTGDIGWLDDDGVLWLAGRNESFVKLRGVRVSYDEIETTLLGLPGIQGASGVLHSPADGSQPILHLMIVSSEPYDTSRLRKALPAVWWPFEVHLLDELPRNSHGKLDRRQLQQLVDAA